MRFLLSTARPTLELVCHPQAPKPTRNRRRRDAAQHPSSPLRILLDLKNNIEINALPRSIGRRVCLAIELAPQIQPMPQACLRQERLLDRASCSALLGRETTSSWSTFATARTRLIDFRFLETIGEKTRNRGKAVRVSKDLTKQRTLSPC
jgi:hypothetical protein